MTSRNPKGRRSTELPLPVRLLLAPLVALLGVIVGGLLGASFPFDPWSK